MSIHYVGLVDQWESEKKDLIPIIEKLLSKGIYVNAPENIQFEEKIAKLCNTKYAVGLNSGTDALTFALYYTGVRRGDEVITVPNSFIATAATIVHLGAKPIFVDTELNTLNIDINEFEIDSLRSQIAYVDQDVRLFNDTVRGNIALGQTNTMSNAQIQHAAKTSYAYEFIQELAEQFDTKVGENGLKLSGGQRQRLAIARAIAKNSPILILDEATSALDLTTEKQVQSAIDEMQKDRTTVIIAHRLSTIKKADRIIVLRHGKIIEQGTHQDLIEAKGEYASLYKY